MSRVFPICLSDENGTATFYHNYDPYTSSLLKLVPEFDFSSWIVQRETKILGAPDTAT